MWCDNQPKDHTTADMVPEDFILKLVFLTACAASGKFNSFSFYSRTYWREVFVGSEYSVPEGSEKIMIINCWEISTIIDNQLFSMILTDWISILNFEILINHSLRIDTIYKYVIYVYSSNDGLPISEIHFVWIALSNIFRSHICWILMEF